MTNQIKAMVWVEVREGRKLIGSNKAPLEVVQGLMVSAGINADNIMIKTSDLREGKTFTFKHQGKELQIKPLIGHIDLY